MKRRALSIILAVALILSLFTLSAFAGQEVSYREINYSAKLEEGKPVTGTMTWLTPVAITGQSTGAAAGFTVRLEKDKEYLFSFKATTPYPVEHTVNIMILNNVMQGAFTQDILSTPVVLPEYGNVAATAVRFTAPSTGEFRVLVTEGSLIVDDYKLADVSYTVAVEKLEWEKIKIANRSELDALRDRINSFSLMSAKADVELTAEIDLENANWTGFKVFGGKFNGNGYTVKNFGLGTTNITYSGILGLVMANADVKNVNISNVYSTGGMYVGSLAGKAEYSTITNCTSAGRISGASTEGGLIGSVLNSTVSECSSSCEVIGGVALAGGLIGTITGSTISNCSASGKVACLLGAGGFTGSLGLASSADSCTASGAVSGGSSTGGFAGMMGSKATVNFCKASGTVSGGNDVGGFVGSAGTDTKLTGCSASGAVSGVTSVGGFVGTAALGSIGNECSAAGKATGTACVGGFVGSFFGGNNWLNSYCTGNVESTNSMFQNVTNFYFGGFVGKYTGANSIINCFSIGNIKVYGDKVGGFAGGTDGFGKIDFKNCYTAAKIEITKAEAEEYGSFMGSWSTKSSYISSAKNCFASDAPIIMGEQEITNENKYIGYTSDAFTVKTVDFSQESTASELEGLLNDFVKDDASCDKWSGRNSANGPELVFRAVEAAKGEFEKVVDWVKSQSIVLQIPLWIFYVPVMYFVNLFRNVGK